MRENSALSSADEQRLTLLEDKIEALIEQGGALLDEPELDENGNVRNVYNEDFRNKLGGAEFRRLNPPNNTETITVAKHAGVAASVGDVAELRSQMDAMMELLRGRGIDVARPAPPVEELGSPSRPDTATDQPTNFVPPTSPTPEHVPQTPMPMHAPRNGGL